jgi:hypothetical protein
MGNHTRIPKPCSPRCLRVQLDFRSGGGQTEASGGPSACHKPRLRRTGEAARRPSTQRFGGALLRGHRRPQGVGQDPAVHGHKLCNFKGHLVHARPEMIQDYRKSMRKTESKLGRPMGLSSPSGPAWSLQWPVYKAGVTMISCHTIRRYAQPFSTRYGTHLQPTNMFHRYFKGGEI